MSAIDYLHHRGEDRLLNEYFIEACNILAGHITELFNKILNSGFFSVAWTRCIIVPIHQKGDKSDVKNYRGITLLSIFSKLFTCVLNQRILYQIGAKRIMLFLAHNLALEKVDQLLMLCLSSSQFIYRNM